MFLNNATVTVRRRAGGSYVNGVYQDGAETTFNLTDANVFNLSPEQIEMLPEGFRTSARKGVITATELKVLNSNQEETDDSEISQPDVVEYGGALWLVVAELTEFEAFVFNHKQYALAKQSTRFEPT